MSIEHTLIFGGTKGIGRVLALELLAAGNRVTVLGRTPLDAALSGAGARHVRCDFLDRAVFAQTLAQLSAEEPPPNHLVFLQRFRGEGDRWQGELDAALGATRQAIEAFAPRFDPAANNAIVLVSSVAGEFIASDQPVSYHLAKAGLQHLARYFAVTLGTRRVRVNTVSPATTVKPESAAFYSQATALNDLYQRIVPLGRMGRAEDVTGVVRFLCSPAAAFVTGQTILVDGGVSLHSQESLARRLTQI